MPDDHLVGLLLASRRLTAWQAGIEFAAIAELDARRRKATPRGTSATYDHITAEVAAALVLSSRPAEELLELARGVARFPGVQAALLAGQVDRDRVAVFVAELAMLDDQKANAVAAAFTDVAGKMTTGQLRRALRHLVLSLFPETARERAEKARKHARVETWTELSGNGALAGRELPQAELIAADQRIRPRSLAVRLVAPSQPERAQVRHGNAGQIPKRRADDQRSGAHIENAAGTEEGSHHRGQECLSCRASTGLRPWNEDPAAQVAHPLQGFLAAEQPVAPTGTGQQARGEGRGAAALERDGALDGMGAHGCDEVRSVGVCDVDATAGHRPFEPLGQAHMAGGAVAEVGNHLLAVTRQADVCLPMSGRPAVGPTNSPFTSGAVTAEAATAEAAPPAPARSTLRARTKMGMRFRYLTATSPICQVLRSVVHAHCRQIAVCGPPPSQDTSPGTAPNGRSYPVLPDVYPDSPRTAA